MEGEWLVIGISGVTCGGKTTLANKLLETVVPVYVFNQDQYFYPDDSPHHIPCEGLSLSHNNYDRLSALDMAAMMRDILATLGGRDSAHARNTERPAEGGIEVPGRRVMIIEGFTALNYEPIMELCHLRYYLVLEYAECRSRRSFRLYSPPDVDGYFDACVWPEHLRYKAELQNDKRVVFIDGTRHDAFDIVMNDLKQLGAVKIES